MKDKFHRIYWSKEFDWEEYAKRYNKYCKTDNNYYKQSAEILLNCSDIKDNNVILDLGCGTGAMSREILKRFPKIKIIAIDLSKEALEYYRKNFEKQIKTGQIIAIECNAEKIKEQIKHNVDIVFISSALWDMEIKSLFKNLKKILNKNGLIIANLPYLTINKNEGFIYKIEDFFRKKSKIQKLYRRILLKNLNDILINNKLRIRKTQEYNFNLSKDNIKRFFDVLKYRYPFIFFPDKISYEERYKKCEKLFNQLLTSIPKIGIEERGLILLIDNKVDVK